MPNLKFSVLVGVVCRLLTLSAGRPTELIATGVGWIFDTMIVQPMHQDEPIDLTTEEMVSREELLEMFLLGKDTFLLLEAITCHLEASTMPQFVAAYRFEVYSLLDSLSTRRIPLREDVLMLHQQIIKIVQSNGAEYREMVMRTVQEVASQLEVPSYPTSQLYDIDETVEMLDDIRDMPHVPIPFTMEENIMIESFIHLFMKGTITSESNPSEFRQLCEAINTCYKLSEIRIWWLQTKMRVSKMIMETSLPAMIALVNESEHFSESTQSVLAGSKDGTLFAHKIANRGTGAIPKYAFEYIAKKFERHPVMNMTICEEKNLILCTSQGLLTVHILNDLQHPVINILHNVKPIQSFAIWIREDDDHLYIITSSRKKIQFFQWIDKEFQELALDCGIIFPETPLNLTMCKNALIFSVRDEYYVAIMQKPTDDNELWALELRKFASTESSPVILYVKDQNLIGVCRNDMLCFFSLEHEPEKRMERPVTDIRFSEAPLALAYDPPYVVALLSKGKIEIRSFNPSMCVQNIVLSKAQFICSGNRGQIYIGSSTGVNRIWVLDSAPNLRKNVATLVSEKYFDLAIQIADLSEVFSEENKIEIKRQAAANLFNQRKFEESFQLHMQIGSDVLQVIRLIPDLLPDIAKPSLPASDLSANEKKRALLAMGNYLSAIRADYVKKNDPKAGITLTKEEIQNIHRTMIIIDTTLLNCYLQTKPILVDSLLRLHNNFCAFEDAQAILKKAHKLPSLFVLYETKKKHELALELLFEQSENLEADFFFEGNERIVDYLQSLGNTHLELIFEYAKKILSRSREDGLSVFTGEESDVARSLDREKVLDFLKSSCTAVVIPYLEYIIYKWDEVRPSFHEALLENYINTVKKLMEDYVHTFKDGILVKRLINAEILDENINRAGEEEGDLGIYRTKLIHFLQFSLQYNPQGILFQLSNLPLYEERALILGRLKMHEQALTIYTTILNDFEAAENYCQLYYDKNDTINSQVYLQWLRAYIQPYEPQKAGLTETPFIAPPPDVCSAIRVLSRHADRIDTVSALEDFPNETQLCTLSRALIAVLQTVRDNSISLSMRQSVSESALNYAEARLKQLESIRVVITNASDCMKCGKKIGNSAFVRSPEDESLVHFYCNK